MYHCLVCECNVRVGDEPVHLLYCGWEVMSGPPMRWETPLCVCGNVLHTFLVSCQSCWPENIGPEFVTIFRLCSTCPSLSWRLHVMLAGWNITWWTASWFKTGNGGWYKKYKNSSGDEIADVNFLTTISHTRIGLLQNIEKETNLLRLTN